MDFHPTSFVNLIWAIAIATSLGIFVLLYFSSKRKTQPQAKVLWLLYSCAALSPLLAAWLYLDSGQLQKFVRHDVTQGILAQNDNDPQKAVNQLIAGVEKELQMDPNNLELASRVSHLYLLVQDYSKAYKLLKSFYAKNTKNVAYLEMLVQASFLLKQEVDSEVEAYMQDVLSLDSTNELVLSFKAFDYEANGQYIEAANLWKTLYDQEQQTDLKQEFFLAWQENLQKTKDNQEQAPDFALKVKLSVADFLKTRLQPENPVFVILRDTSEDTGPPLAVKRLRLQDILQNNSILITPSDAMNPSINLQSFDAFVLYARYSSNFTASKQVGDIESQKLTVSPHSEDVFELVLQKIIEY